MTAIRSLVISHKLLGTREWFVVHHTDCGMEFFTDVGAGPGATEGDHSTGSRSPTSRARWSTT